MSQKVQDEREAERKRQREEREADAFAHAERVRDEMEYKTLLEIAAGEDNPEAAKNKIIDEVYHYALIFDFMACYLHSVHGFPPPMMYDEEKRRLKEMNPKFKVPIKIESDN